MSPKKTILETGTTVHTGLACFAIACVTDVTFTTLVGLTGDSVSGVTFPKGLTIFGNFNEVTLASGSALFYTL